MARAPASATILKRKLAEIRAGMPFVLDKQEIGDGLVRRIKERFRRGVDPDEVKWKELAPGYKKRKPILNRAKILVNTQKLYDSIQVIKGRPAGRFASAIGAGFRIGIESIIYEGKNGREEDTAKYGRYHQQGAAPNKKRRMIGFNAKDREFVLDKVRESVKKLIA